MKTTFRNRYFLAGIFLFMVIILLLFILAGFYLNQLSDKTKLIVDENHISVVFAREMAQSITIINDEITRSVITKSDPDTNIIRENDAKFYQNFLKEKDNITEKGEFELVNTIKNEFDAYKKLISATDFKTIVPAQNLNLSNQFKTLYNHLIELSQMNEAAIYLKTSKIQTYAHKAVIRMSLIGTICCIIAFGFTFMFGSFFSDRFYQFYNEVKLMNTNMFKEQMIINGKDEIGELAEIINQMANQITVQQPKNEVTSPDENLKYELKEKMNQLELLIARLHILENDAVKLISEIDKRK